MISFSNPKHSRLKKAVLMRVSVEDVWVHWAFCEAQSDRFDHWCPNPAINDLRRRIRSGAAKHQALSPGDKQTLRRWISKTREPYLAMYIEDIDFFIIEEWPQDRLRAILCMSQMDPRNRGRLITLGEYMNHAPDDPNNRLDPRVVATEGRDPVTCPDPIVIGYWKGLHVLVDGYRRSILFLKSGTSDRLIKAYVPQPKM
jgi:hypothetical protein